MSREITLAKGQVAIVDDEDFERVNAKHWMPRKDSNSWYAIRHEQTLLRKTTIMMHRFILGADSGTEIDHWNGNGLDNRKENLRVATKSQNAANRFKQGGSSKYKGVSWYAPLGQWRSRIKKDKHDIHIGYFDVEEDAARAYDEKAQELFGEYARTNF
jgi:hypothetical protein